MEFSRQENFAKVQHVHLNFGDVEVGVTKIKSIKIVNQSKRQQFYAIQRDSTSNPLDCVFHTVEYSWSLPPNESYVCDISYRPILANRKYTDYFFITDTYKRCYKVIVQGFCTGPKVVSSKARLVMVCTSEQSQVKTTFKLTNSTDVPAKFMFDIDIAQCPFKINEVSGVIKATSSKTISVSFEPTDIGIYKFYMPCLILNQDPIILEVYGINVYNSSADSIIVEEFNSKVDHIEPFDVTDNFRNYMSDITFAVTEEPPSVSLSWSCVDFGQAEIGAHNFGKRTPQTVCLTNHNKIELLVLWEQDVSDIFSICPREAKVRGNKSIIFEVRFDPTKERTFYSRELMARVFRLPCCIADTNKSDKLLMDVIPEFVSIRLIGHTYSLGFNDWMPQYTIPEAVTMPACLPAMPVYTTFVIKKFGQHPLMFSFISPATSHYSVKPMMGLISHEQEYQLIAVQLFPEYENEQAYVERWAVRLNGNSKNEIYVDFQGFAENVSLIFEEDNSVILDPVHVGCQQSRSVQVRNPTRHSIHFEYMAHTLPRELCIGQLTGLIHPNETVLHDWVFATNELKTYNFDICCSIIADIGGRIFVIQIDVSGKSAEGSLLAIPEHVNFGKLMYNECWEKEFKAFNFSQVTINYLLVCRPTKSFESMNAPERDVKISPIRGSISPGKREKIQVLATPTQPGFYELTIEYLIRPDPRSDFPIPLSKPKHLCTISCLCFLPALQVKDLLYQAETNKGVSKLSLWKSLRIDELNSVLQNLLPFQDASLEMIVPLEFLNEDEKFIIKLLLINMHSTETSWSLKKQRNCLCNDRSEKKKFIMNRTTKGDCLYCVQDKSCIIYPKNIILKANEKEILTIEIKSKTLQPCGIVWDVDIGEGRCISLNIKLETSLIWSGSRLTFKNVHIGQCSNMHYQAIWLYNNEESARSYTIDTKRLALINKKYCGIIFKCLNTEGTIQGHARIPVLFGFSPNKFGKFDTVVTVKVGAKESALKIEAECTYLPKLIDVEHEKCPLSDIFKTPDIVVYLNSNYIILPSVPTHGKVTKMCMMHNHHQHNVLYYEWKNYEIPGVVKISIDPISGIMQPQTLLTFLVHILVGFYDCSIDVDLFCDFIDISERRFVEKKKSEQERYAQEKKHEFTITEKDMIYAEVPEFEPIKKPLTFCKTLTVKINIYDSKKFELNTELLQQLKDVPTEEVSREIISSENKFSSEIVNMSSEIFECIIWDIITSKYLTRTITGNLAKIHDLTYSELPVKLTERKYRTERSNKRPPKRLIEDIMHTMICMIVHEEFNFDTDHFSHPPDVRQISYQKTYSESITYHKQAIINEKAHNLFKSKDK